MKTILCIDDKESTRTLVGKLVEQLGYTYLSADTGPAGETLAPSADLILLDLHMPGQDGFMTIENIRQKLNITVPVICLTADAIKGTREQVLAAGFNDYLTKPLEFENLIILTQKYLLSGV